MPNIDLARFMADSGIWKATERVYMPEYLMEEPRPAQINKARMWLDAYIRKFEWRYDHCVSFDAEVLGYPFMRLADTRENTNDI